MFDSDICVRGRLEESTMLSDLEVCKWASPEMQARYVQLLETTNTIIMDNSVLGQGRSLTVLR